MDRRSALPTLVILACLSLGACGGEEKTPEAPPDADVSLAKGDEPERPTEAGLLTALAERITRGEGISDASWSTDVQNVAFALWPREDAEDDQAARRDHANLAHIAGDMAVQLARDEAARASWLEHDPLSVRIYDGFVAAASKGVDAYRAWVAEGGRALLAERLASMMEERPPR